MKTRVTLLGATGSIGASAIDILYAHRDIFDVVAVVANHDAEGLAKIAVKLNADFAALADEICGSVLSDALEGSQIASGAGDSAVNDAVARDTDIVIAGIAGTAGLRVTRAAMKPGRTIALANKECLVCAGAAFMQDAARLGTKILPLDSEHNALYQALAGAPISTVETMTITASGGPFLTWSAADIAKATPKQALAHPKWSMGPKISIDSATLMNKGLELIEAHHLFGILPSQLAVIVHPEAIVHGLVQFTDGSVTAGMAAPDMRIAMAHCLGEKTRLKFSSARFDLAQLARLTFAEPDENRFPALRLAKAALAAGGAMPTVLNAANEIAVAAFLAGHLNFPGISALVEKTCAAYAGSQAAPSSVADALAVDHDSRLLARSLLSRRTVAAKDAAITS
jgi:1-deoxy-D-xylulose-5-phosphate reductoisomerase